MNEAPVAASQTRSALATDVAIVGGGVAGSSLGAVLAAAGLGVVVVEREARFKDCVRGEALHPWGAAEADRLGLIPTLRVSGAHPLPIWQRYEDRAPVDPYCWADDVPGGHVEWGVSHPDLQEALLRLAAERGATVLRPARILDFRRGLSSELVVAGDSGEVVVRPRLVVGADGRRSGARRWVEAGTRSDPTHHCIGGILLDGVALDPDRAHQAYHPGGMTIVFPRGQGRARAYVVCDPARAAALQGPNAPNAFVERLAATLPDGAFAAARPAGPAAVFPGTDTWSERIADDGVVLVGDAAGANDPSQGHGLSLVFRDARELRDLLLGESDWARAIAAFADRRAAYHAVLRAHAQWAGVLITEEGPEADARRERAARAREIDPTAGGFAGIYAFGPDGLVGDEAARRRFFGEDLVPSVAAR